MSLFKLSLVAERRRCHLSCLVC